jgi:hypothetical protein
LNRGKTLGAAPARFTNVELQAWRDICGACADPLQYSDGMALEWAAVMLAHWRAAGGRKISFMRTLCRVLRLLLVPAAARRQLLFGYRH